MRLGVRGREALVVSLLTLLVVATATAIHLSQVSRVVVQEAVKQAELIAKQIYAQSGRALQRAPGADPLDALRDDPELRSFLDSSVGYSPHLLYALISDATGTVLLHTERRKEGQSAPERPSLEGLLKLDTLSRFSALYNAGRTYETALPVTLNDRLFGSHPARRLHHAPPPRGDRVAPAEPRGGRGGPAARLARRHGARPAHRAAHPRHRGPGRPHPPRRADRGRPRWWAATSSRSSPPSSRASGRELQADRLSTLSEKAHLQQVVDQLEDGVIFLNPERRILFFNRVAETVVGLSLEQTVGLPIHEVLDPTHPLLPFVDQVVSGATGHPQRHRDAPAGRPREGVPRLRLPHAGRPPGDGGGGAAEGSRVDQDRAVARELLGEARRAGAAHLRGRPRGEEPAQRDDDPRRAAQGAARGGRPRRPAEPRGHRERDPAAGPRGAGVPQVHAAPGADPQAGGPQLDAAERGRAARGGGPEPRGALHPGPRRGPVRR